MRGGRRSLNEHGKTDGYCDDNDFLNSIVCDDEFYNGQVNEYGANILGENMHTQLDSDGYSLTLMDSIIDHHMDIDEAVMSKEK